MIHQQTTAHHARGSSGFTNVTNKKLAATYNTNEFGPSGKQGGPKVEHNAQEQHKAAAEDRHPQDKVLEYRKEGQPTEDEFCTANSSIQNLDNYFIGKRIGQGAYAVVRLGLHRALNQKIAVKIYEKVKLMEPNRRKSVKREMKIMEKLDQDHIAKLYEVFESHK